ncbi:hypothetical protein CIK05_11770 [Bdellovibrio sp. qaytius]|nr:hypothetical protein CIK05_11770 [Bdellovibrio sp. qaytius]
MKRLYIVFFLVVLISSPFAYQRYFQKSKPVIDEKPLPQSQISSDIDLLVGTLDEVYAGKQGDPENYKILVDNLNKIKTEPLGEWAFYQKIDAALKKFPDGHLQAVLPGKVKYRLNRTMASLPDEAKSKDDTQFTEKTIKGKKTLIVTIPTFMIVDPIAKQNIINELIEKSKTADYLIFDLRENTGGYQDMPLKIGAVLWGENFREDKLIQYYHMPISKYREWYNRPIYKLSLNLLNEQDLGNEYASNLEKYLKEPIVIDASREEQNDTIKDEMQIEKNGFAKPIFILVDNYCASSCELMLDALEMHPYATSIGNQTLGATKYSNPVLLTLPASSINVLLPTAYLEYFDKRNVERKGYTPKILISEEDDAMKKAESLIN